MKQTCTFQELIDAPVPNELFEDMTYAQFLKLADPGRLQRSATVRGPPMQIYGNKNREYHVFNFKSYIAFKKPAHGRVKVPVEKLPVEVDCDCEDYRYRWAWANRQKGAGKIGPQSLNKCLNRAPVKTNPSGKPALCKHLLAARHHIMGLLAHFPKPPKGEPDVDISWKLDQLVKKTQDRYDNYDAHKAKAVAMTAQKNLVRNYRNVYGPMPQAEVPRVPNNEPVPLPPEAPGEPLPQQPPRRKPNKPAQTPPGAAGKLPPKVEPAPAKLPSKAPAKSPTKSPTKLAGQPKPGEKPAAKPPVKPQNKKRTESLVVISNSENRMNAELLKQTKAICEEMADEIEQGLTAPEGEGAPEAGAELPPPGGDEMPPMGDEMPPMGGDEMGAENPEDEALNLLRDIAGGITRMADEIAPVEAPEGAEPEGELPPDEPEGEEPEGEEGEEEGEGAAVPPVEDEDEFTETMPVSTGA